MNIDTRSTKTTWIVEHALDTAAAETRIAAVKRASAFDATSAPILDLAGLKAIADPASARCAG